MHCAEKHSALCNLRTRYHTMCSDQCGVQLYYVVQWSVCSKQSRYLWNTKILFHVFNKELSTIVQTKVTAMKCKTAQCNKMLRSAVQCSKRLCNAYQWSEVHLDQNWAKSRHLLFKTFELSNAMDSRIVQWCMVWLCINLSSMQYKVALYSGWFGFVLIFWVFWSEVHF